MNNSMHKNLLLSSVAVTPTSHKQFKVLHVCWVHSIGGYTGVGTRVSIHGVVQGQVVTDKVDISSTS